MTTGCGCGREVACADWEAFGVGLGEAFRGVGDGDGGAVSLGVGTTTSSVPPDASRMPSSVRHTAATTATPEITAIRRDRAIGTASRFRRRRPGLAPPGSGASVVLPGISPVLASSSGHR
ncbi:hypothetical protein [Herbidospora sp. NBRC 101105]|uniref:hypothetical protein n=1 Tax=Herbidospora sp. NBRC 101105 TaxID=3032195 RepID=UPI0025568BE2|nr:hypothetical protein [Herbidospora sp. NBRC 101105]